MGNRLDKLRHDCRYPFSKPDIDKLRKGIPELRYARTMEIDAWYREFSEEVWACGWLFGPAVTEFRQWLLEDLNDHPPTDLEEKRNLEHLP